METLYDQTVLCLKRTVKPAEILKQLLKTIVFISSG